MKLAGARAATFCGRPDLRLTGALLHGPDASLVAVRRRQLVNLLTGGDDMRLTRLEPGPALKDPAGIDAALRARGFFPGRRVVLIEAARDALAAPLRGILAALVPEQAKEEEAAEAFLVVTASNLTARSALRRLFEGNDVLAALGLYPEPPDVAELSVLLGEAGVEGALTADALQDLALVAGQTDRGSLGQLIEKIAVYSLNRTTPLNQTDIAPILPAAGDSGLDRLVATVAEGRTESVGPMMGKMASAGIGAAGMLIAMDRHFRQLLGLAAAPDGIDAALGRLRPPAFGPRRRALAAQARNWGTGRLETANRVLFQAERTLRSPGTRPDRALVERCLIRLSMMVARR